MAGVSSKSITVHAAKSHRKIPPTPPCFQIDAKVIEDTSHLQNTDFHPHYIYRGSWYASIVGYRVARVSAPFCLFPNIAFPPMACGNAAGRDTNNITHAILIPLIAVLHSRARALEAVVPSRDARIKPNPRLKQSICVCVMAIGSEGAHRSSGGP
jgi:hypothetical protein